MADSGTEILEGCYCTSTFHTTQHSFCRPSEVYSSQCTIDVLFRTQRKINTLFVIPKSSDGFEPLSGSLSELKGGTC